MARGEIEKVTESFPLFMQAAQVRAVLGLSKDKFQALRQTSKTFPKPLEIEGRPLYSRDQIAKWVAQICGEIEA